jgi:hypothetical protein
MVRHYGVSFAAIRAFFSVLRFLGLSVLSDCLEDEVDKDSEELEDGL